MISRNERVQWERQTIPNLPTSRLLGALALADALALATAAYLGCDRITDPEEFQRRVGEAEKHLRVALDAYRAEVEV